MRRTPARLGLLVGHGKRGEQPQQATLSHSWLPERFPDKAWNGQCGLICLPHPPKQPRANIYFLQLPPLPQNILCLLQNIKFFLTSSPWKVFHILIYMSKCCLSFQYLHLCRTYTLLQPYHPSAFFAVYAAPSSALTSRVCQVRSFITQVFPREKSRPQREGSCHGLALVDAALSQVFPFRQEELYTTHSTDMYRCQNC